VTADQPPADRLRIAELLVPLSLVTDLGMGVPDGQAARACLLATGLARRMGLSGSALADVYYTTLLKHLGCTATAAEEASHLDGDELATRPLFSRTDETRPRELLSLLASIGGGKPLRSRGRVVVGAITGMRWSVEVQRAVCEVATLVAERLEMSEAVRESLGQTFERWDGKGQSRGLEGEAIAFPARIAHVASRAAAFHELGGVDAAVASVRQSRGGWFDPEIADAFVTHGRALLAELDAGDPLDAALEQEPQPWRTVHAGAVEQIARAFADMADLKSSFTLGHSPGVAELVRAAAPQLGLSETESDALQLAALLHDLGRVGVPSGIWEKRSPLGGADWERVRLHPYYTERILARGRTLAGIAPLAGMHHERLDGSGYHRGSRAREIPWGGGCLPSEDAGAAAPRGAARRSRGRAAGRAGAARPARRGRGSSGRRGCGRAGAAGRAGVPRRADGARARGAAAARGGLFEPTDRRPTSDLAAHGGAPRPAHLREDRPLHARRSDDVRAAARAARTVAQSLTFSLAHRRRGPACTREDGQTYPCGTGLASSRCRRTATDERSGRCRHE
jgi:HD-GYP domain-containing protein (c-di-GMP phosphodiesterase class II)